MRSLKEVIQALRGELEAALEEKQPLPAGARLEAERAVITLQFSLADIAAGNGARALSFAVPTPGAKETPSLLHSVTIEFKSRANPLAQASGVSATAAEFSAAPATLEGAEAELVTQQLSRVFGPPGFDSSARATVFREALENLSARDTQAAIACLAGKSVPRKNETLQGALARLQRVCQSGPAGLAQGKTILIETLQRHPLNLLLQHVATVWRSQENWMA